MVVMKVAIVIVTYNKPDIFEVCLQGVLNQTLRPFPIVVIDNSNDNLTENIIKTRYPSVIYRHFHQNIGSAGGYFEGIKIACEGSDFVWTLDDDIQSDPGTLAEAIAYVPLLSKKGRIGALRSGWGFKVGDFKPIDSFAWRGALIACEAIKAIGLPDRDFFLYGEDVEYSLRLRKAGYLLFNVFAGRLQEIQPSPREIIAFLGIKFRFYAQPFRLYYGFRNELVLHYRYAKYLKYLKSLAYALTGIIIFSIRHNPPSRQAILRGVIDGFSGKLGKTYEDV